MDTKPAVETIESLVHQYGKLVFHTIYGLTGDWEESQDLTQDTFHQALKAIDAARKASGAQFHARAWLLSIALNSVRMQQRRRSLFRFIPFSHMSGGPQSEKDFETGVENIQGQAAPVQPTGYGARENSDPAELVAERDAVQRTLARLTESLRVCLVLSVIGNFSTPEIARILEIEEAAVRQRLARARKQFQQFYALESGEQVLDTRVPANEQYAQKQQNVTGRVEFRLTYKNRT